MTKFVMKLLHVVMFLTCTIYKKSVKKKDARTNNCLESTTQDTRDWTSRTPLKSLSIPKECAVLHYLQTNLVESNMFHCPNCRLINSVHLQT